MSTQEILLEEIKHQPEPVLRELRHYLEFLKRQREVEASPGAGRVTNVDPLPDAVLDRIYARPEEEDEAGVQRLMAAQAYGGAD